MLIIRKIFDYIIDFFFPNICAACNKKLNPSNKLRMCKDCFHSLPRIEGLICRVCGDWLPSGGAHCWRCKKITERKKLKFRLLRSACFYKEPLSSVIQKFKYHNRKDLVEVLGRLLIECINKYPYLKQVDTIIPVPLYWLKKLQRGYNQTELVTKYLSKYLNIPVYGDILVRKRWTKSQTKLNKEQRLKNVEDAFYVKNKQLINQKRILLVDDVSTSFATINECAKVLKKFAACEVYGLTIARDVK